MNKDTIQNIFIGILLGGVILLAGGVYYLAMQVQTSTQGIQRIEQGMMEASQKADDAMMKAEASSLKADEAMMKAEENTMIESKTLISLADADRLLTGRGEEEPGWDYALDLSSVEVREYVSGDVRFSVPFNAAWGNAQYRIAPFETRDGIVHFGPMYLSELHGAFRDGHFRVLEKRTAEAAIADERYRVPPCGDNPNPLPRQVTVGAYSAVRFEGTHCEGGLVGYEILGANMNYVFESAPQANDELLKWVIERSQLR